MVDAGERYAAEWERVTRLDRRGAPGALSRLRETAFDTFLSRGFPTTRDEEWRFTSVAPIADRAFALVAEPRPEAFDLDIDPLRVPGGLAAELVFVDGHYAAGLSRQRTLPAGSRAESLRSATAARHDAIEPYLARVAPFDHHPFVALNTAFLHDGAYIELPAGTVLEEPIHVLFVATGRTDGHETMVHPRVLIVLGANTQASVVETYAGPAGTTYFTNAVTEIVLGENAVLDHSTLQNEGASAYHVGAIQVLAQRSGTCTLHAINTGGALVRNDVVAVLNGEGIDCALNGLYVADGQRLIDNHTTIDHAQPHCASREIYKGILGDRAHGVFNGKIVVRPDAQKTDAKQTNRALLLSEGAQINTKPQLEIFANDVKCTHGAAVGQLDDEALFYLRSRGLSAADAQRLLVHAFAADVLSRMPLEPVRRGVEDRLQRQLARLLLAA
jgi:Fe-S cluster assembly protein SufD